MEKKTPFQKRSGKLSPPGVDGQKPRSNTERRQTINLKGSAGQLYRMMAAEYVTAKQRKVSGNKPLWSQGIKGSIQHSWLFG